MLKFALKNLKTKVIRTVLASIAVVLCATIALVSFNTANQVQDGVISTAGYYDTIVGPEGSPLQLTLSSMFYVENPLGTIPYEYYVNLKNDPSVKKVYPIAAGDSYRMVPIIGTIPEYLEEYRLSSGRIFYEYEEAVLGYNVARTGVLQIGDIFSGVHGFAEQGHVHDYFEYAVVGVLAKTGTASDNVIFTTVESVWIIHDHGACGHEDHYHDHDCDHGHNGNDYHDEHCDHEHQQDCDHDHYDEGHEGDHHHVEGCGHEDCDHESCGYAHQEDHHHDAKITGDLVALVIRTESLAAHSMLVSEFQEIPGVQAVNPTAVLRDLLGNLNMGRDILFVLAAIIVFMTAVVIYVTTASFVEDSKKDLQVMRLVGIKRKTIFSIFVLQAAFISAVSIALSFIISSVVLIGISMLTSQNLGIVIDPTKRYPGEFVLVFAIFLIVLGSAIISIIPVYKHDPLEVK